MNKDVYGNITLIFFEYVTLLLLLLFHFTIDDKCFEPTTLAKPRLSLNLTSTTVADTTSRTTHFWEDPTIQYIMIGSGCGIGLLICIITILCIGICTLSVRSKNTALLHARRMEMRYNASQGNVTYGVGGLGGRGCVKSVIIMIIPRLY